MINSLSLVIQLAAIQSVLCGPAPTYKYYSKGPNQLFNNEGSNVVSVSGHNFLTNVSSNGCAQSCDWLRRICECCDSFSYNPSQKTCYIKNRQNTMDYSTYYNADGWQSYFYSSWPPPDLGVVYQIAYGPMGGTWISGMYSHYIVEDEKEAQGWFYTSYVSQGEGKLALNEGQPLKTTSGADKLTSVGNKRCSEECNAVDQCDGFSYNQRLGVCYLKANSGGGKFQTKDNSEGWTFYWKVKYDYNDSKCFCTCKSNYTCVMCRRDGTCYNL